MSADDVALAWVRMHDDDVRGRLESGDLSALGELSLSAEEEHLVRRLVVEFRPLGEVEVFETSALFEAMQAYKGQLSPEVQQTVAEQMLKDEEDSEVQGYGTFSLFSPPHLTTSTRGYVGDPNYCAPMDQATSCHCLFHRDNCW